MNPFESSTFGNSLSLRVDGAIGAMSLSPNGRDAVLAGRKGLFIIDLDDPFLAPRWLHHITSWEVADVQWSPHNSAKPSWCISTSNQKALLWDLARPSNNAIQNVLHRHVRAITDINFHPQDPELLATCSIDTFVYCWDMRTPRRPVKKWAEWRAGATQVKWNHNNSNQIASSHHHSFYIWDFRMGALPLLQVENAHEGKINGLDFNSTENRLISCSNDEKIKIWNLDTASNDVAEPAVVINAQFPISRARSLPFGETNCCGIMPVRGGNDAIYFVNYDDAYNLARSLDEVVEIDLQSDVQFKGHQGPVKDFLWRVQHEKYKNYKKKNNWKDFQLVTWSPTDYDLKLWPLEEKLYDMVNYKPKDHEAFKSLSPETPSQSNLVDLSRTSLLVPSPQLPLEYRSYSTEPETSLSDLLKSTNEDLLSQLALFEIKKFHKQENSLGQLNHLNWISGVRMGSKLSPNDNLNTSSAEGPRNDGPANLGEEISIVGHKFPKIRFEKISVSTGQIILSLRGPAPTLSRSTLVNETEESHFAESQSKRNQNLPNSGSNRPPESANTTTISEKMVSNIDSPIVKASSKGNDADDANTTQTEQMHKPVDQNIENKLIFIRLEIKFAKNYPHFKHLDKQRRSSKSKRSSVIKFDIEETHELNGDIKTELLENLKKISQFYTVKYNKYCLEPCLRYLLGDRIDLNDSLMMSSDVRIENDADVDSKMANDELEGYDYKALMDFSQAHTNDQNVAFAEDYSMFSNRKDCDDEDDYHDVYLMPGPDDDLIGGQELYDPLGSALDGSYLSNARDIKHNITPLPKACSAVWTNSGKLVCFFAPKAQNTSGSRDTYETSTIEKSPGRLSHSVNRAKKLLDVSAASAFTSEDTQVRAYDTDEQASDSENGAADSDSSSSSGDFSDDWNEALRNDLQSYYTMPSALKENASWGRLAHTQSSKKSFQHASGKGTASVSSYLDDNVLRSTKKTKRSTSYKHYIRIHDFSHLMPDKIELAKAYRLDANDLKDSARHNSEVSFALNFQDIGEAWKVVELILGDGDKGHEFPESDFTQMQNDVWGYHPYGNSWLVKVLFDYFERQNNLQMLAMISCVLYQADSNFMDLDREDQLTGQIHSQPIMRNAPKQGTKAPELSRSGSLNLSNQMGLESDTSFRRSYSNTRLNYLTKTISNNNDAEFLPPQYQQDRKFGELCNSSFGNGASIDKRISESQKRSTPKKAFLMSRGISRSNGKSITSGMNKRDKIRSSISVSITISNSADMGVRTGYQNLRLLNGIDGNKIRSYRNRYAELLYSWNLPKERIQVLKFNHVSNSMEMPLSHEYESHKCHYAIRNKKFYTSEQEFLVPISPVDTSMLNSWNTVKRSQVQSCAFCNQTTSRRILFCLDCEHILHFDCAKSWWEDIDGAGAEDGCPTGCGCDCASSKSYFKEMRPL